MSGGNGGNCAPRSSACAARSSESVPLPLTRLTASTCPLASTVISTTTVPWRPSALAISGNERCAISHAPTPASQPRDRCRPGPPVAAERPKLQGAQARQVVRRPVRSGSGCLRWRDVKVAHAADWMAPAGSETGVSVAACVAGAPRAPGQPGELAAALTRLVVAAVGEPPADRAPPPNPQQPRQNDRQGQPEQLRRHQSRCHRFPLPDLKTHPPRDDRLYTSVRCQIHHTGR